MEDGGDGHRGGRPSPPRHRTRQCNGDAVRDRRTDAADDTGDRCVMSSSTEDRHDEEHKSRVDILSSAPCRVTSTSSSDEDDAGVAADSEHTSGMSPRRGSSQLCSSLSSENLQRELAQSAAADGLSDQEQVVRRMRLHVKQSPDRLLAAATASVLHLDTSSSEDEDDPAMTPHVSQYHIAQSVNHSESA